MGGEKMKFSPYKRCRGVNCAKKSLIVHKTNNNFIRYEIRTHDNKTIWSLLKNYINNLKVNEEFNRKDLLSCVYVHPLENILCGCQTSVDQYRRYITINGFLSHTGHATYKKLKNIPENASIHKLKKHAYDRSWRSWYIKPEDL